MKDLLQTFIEVPSFTKQWADLGLDDDDLFELQKILIKDPEAGDLIQQTGGLRKLRFAIEGRGKRSGARVCYVEFYAYETIYLITAYAKNEKVNLTDAEKNKLRNLVKRLKDECSKKYKGEK